MDYFPEWDEDVTAFEEKDGFATLEAAAREDIPVRYARIETIEYSESGTRRWSSCS